jgi:hypothetical protein
MADFRTRRRQWRFGVIAAGLAGAKQHSVLVNVPVDVDLLPRKSAASWQGAQLVTARPLSFAKAKFEHPRCSAPSAGSTTAK